MENNMKRFVAYTAIFLTTFLLTVCAISCAPFGEYVLRTDEVSQKLITEVPAVAKNPADVEAWVEIAKALGYIIAGAGAKTGVDVVRKKKVA
jgi:hypothetical protein